MPGKTNSEKIDELVQAVASLNVHVKHLQDGIVRIENRLLDLERRLAADVAVLKQQSEDRKKRDELAMQNRGLVIAQILGAVITVVLSGSLLYFISRR